MAARDRAQLQREENMENRQHGEGDSPQVRSSKINDVNGNEVFDRHSSHKDKEFIRCTSLSSAVVRDLQLPKINRYGLGQTRVQFLERSRGGNCTRTEFLVWTTSPGCTGVPSPGAVATLVWKNSVKLFLKRRPR